MKFNLGDKVKDLSSKEVHEVVGITLDVSGITYKVSSKEVDVSAKEIVNGVSFYKEEELEAVE